MLRAAILLITAIGVLLFIGCSEQETGEPAADAGDETRERAERVLDQNMGLILAYADSVEQALRPEPLLRPAQIAAFDRYRNAAQVARARQLGIPQPVTREAVQQHLESGRLVELVENEYWTIREMEYGESLATPDVEALLTEMGERFHAELAERGLPPLRLEITSVLRTEEAQARLRRVNPNAARGVSAHQFGTTFDVAYSSFRAPLEPVLDLDTDGAPWIEPHLRQMEALAAETGAARMSRELQAVLGHVLREMQNEGKVMVTMEILQPVYHMTVARRF